MRNRVLARDVLILFPRELYDRKMSMVRRRVLQHLKKDGAILSGQGWDNYNDSLSLQENVNNILPTAKFLLSYKPLGQHHGAIRFPPLHGVKDCSVPMCMSYNECWDVPWTEQEICESETTLVICHHLADLPRLLHLDHSGRQIQHIPHCADPFLFIPHSRKWEEREIDVLLTGVLSQEIYPVRQKMYEACRSGSIKGRVEILPHPGYRMKDLTDCQHQEVKYAQMLGNAKISLVCSSKYYYGLAKYVESFMAGCYVIGCNISEFTPCAFGRLPANILSQESRYITDLCNKALEPDSLAKDISRGSQRIARQCHTVSRYCDTLLETMANHLNYRQRIKDAGCS